ncbi:MAG: peptide/nickel transport system permease protein [Candidatus Binatota bacterium]|nr:peptide/nickel transport system permease protein [Candidatus Binatota bacterium]
MSRAGTRFGWLVVGTLLATGALAPVISPADPARTALTENLRPPSLAHPFGQDRLGRDLLSRSIYGARVSLVVGFSTVAVSLAIGTAIGLLAGTLGGWTDEALMRLVDVLLAFPGVLLSIALAAILGPGLVNVVLALSLVGWTGFARLVRAETLSLRARPHVEAARSLGAGEVRIALRHVVPLLAGPLAVQATFSLAGAIVAEASLSFLGLGTQPPTPSWGAMLSEGRAFLLVAPHVALFPGAAIFSTVLGINFLGDGLRDRLDVRSAAVRTRSTSGLTAGTVEA